MNGSPLEVMVVAIKEAENILILTHIHPDGDALGSQLGLGYILRDLGKQVCLYGESEVSHLYDFLPGAADITVGLPELGSFDCAIALDCGDAYRLGGEMAALLTVKPFLVIDHHAGHREFGDLRWVDPGRASTGEMVYDLAVALGAEVSPAAAYCLYTAVVSDTGSFKYSSTSADTFRVARELILKGVKPAEVAGKLFDNYTMPRLRLFQRVLESLQLLAGGRIALISAPRRLFDETGAAPHDTEGFINYPRALACVQVAAFLKEAEPGKISVSMRSKDSSCDVSLVAAKFGGGGHRNAAGFKRLDTTIEQLGAELLRELEAVVVHH
ncbi:MAG TPA: bifunctional oligoribonuclease/PAP phosphatase NrnA [Desulfurivibrio alkaliphilus]|uniref:Bifunctional oligoribonuclease/PAP phosphatase NrnA n=1 Tax=Desulfurivibrio alkaliphilus TaxID=427923 RepID=A0A7C2XFI5_9BACT|nr:bifunctional oligoribonuclease/PAP phosphatase NrnA [Desulfurivibrio alkaliphilus]